MKLSVIIVNYNVRYFLENCLKSVQVAAQKLGNCEIIVVDNNSVDGSVEMLRESFSNISIVENKINSGFSKANNQAIKISKGEFILLLNPDTIVEEDTFLDCYHFMKSHPDAGGLGVYMVDGKGEYLPESKRGLPTPAVAFYKIFGFSSLFPKSKKYGRYHLGYLDKNETNQIDVLSGAYMWLRKETLDNVGLLDEKFFMYGEDIDLSYRITLAGYKNYYFPKARIIHYKGESTKKNSINYVFVFYRAMVIFAKKHFSKKNAHTFSFFINLAIYIRAGLAILNRLIKQITLPLFDAAIMATGLFGFKNYYEENVRFISGGSYPESLITYGFSAIIILILLANTLSGAYSNISKFNRLIKGTFLGGLTVLIFYSLLDESFRFSRALVLFGVLWALIALPLFRLLLHLLGIIKLKRKQQKRIAIVGSAKEVIRIENFLKKSLIETNFIAKINPSNTILSNEEINYIGKLYQLKDIVAIYQLNEIIYCSKDLSAFHIISSMVEINEDNVEFKIAPAESLYIIGSNSIQNSGDFYIFDTNIISKAGNRRKKRIFDLFTSLALIICSPVIFLFYTDKKQFFRNLLLVFSSRLSWIGFQWKDNKNVELPKIKKGVLSPSDIIEDELINEETINNANFQYCRDYSVNKDFEILFKNLDKLDWKPKH